MRRVFLLLALASLISSAHADDSTQRQTPWTSSNVHGSPDPPLPYKARRIFAKVRLQSPTDVVWLPAAQRWIATQQAGQIVSFVNDPNAAVAEPFLDLSDLHKEPVFRAFATTFHHDLSNQPWCFVTYSSVRADPQGSHLIRLKVTDPAGPVVDLDSRQVCFSWDSQGHSGGSMQFGPDGMFYVSVGDGQDPYPPDGKNTGQDLSDYESSILRLDVDCQSDDPPYRIPVDNPFVGQPNVKGEIWAFGLRNPWKIAFHPDTGDLLAADVGWEMREMIYRVTRGANFGWSVTEGSQPVKDQQPLLPIKAPLFEHTHIDSRSITGGHVWKSERFADLVGAYIYGDWMTGKVWALKSDGDRVLWQKELADTPLQIVCFMQAPDGEVLMVGYDGTIWELSPNSTPETSQGFPKSLTETGLFDDVAEQEAAAGVVEYDINAHRWADGTFSRQWIGIPGTKQLRIFRTADWQTGQVKGRFDFPKGTVLAKTVSYIPDSADMESARKIETQLLHKGDDEWRAYNYIWNEDQTDALLQDDVASDRQLRIVDESAPNGVRTQTWHHSSRSECLLCHIWSAGTIHGFAPNQLNVQRSGVQQLERLRSHGLFCDPIPDVQPRTSPHDVTASLEDRSRAYLDLNCATCHRPLGGGTANFHFDLDHTLEENGYVDVPPAQGDFGLPNARILAPGEPSRSVMLYRAIKSGRGHMPQFGSNVTDYQGIRLLRDWIVSLQRNSTATQEEDSLIARLHDAKNSEEEILRLLERSDTALTLSIACTSDAMEAKVRSRIVEIATKDRRPQIRDLFEHFLPEEQRIKRLGNDIDESQLLAMIGSSQRGKELFERAIDVNCRSCHRIGAVGENVGPNLSDAAKSRTPEQILASILRPSEKIENAYQTSIVFTSDGRVRTGIVVNKDANDLVLADSSGKTHRISRDSIDDIELSATSVMPQNLLSGMTPQQAADLLAYLVASQGGDGE